MSLPVFLESIYWLLLSSHLSTPLRSWFPSSSSHYLNMYDARFSSYSPNRTNHHNRWNAKAFTHLLLNQTSKKLAGLRRTGSAQNCATRVMKNQTCLAWKKYLRLIRIIIIAADIHWCCVTALCVEWHRWDEATSRSQDCNRAHSSGRKAESLGRWSLAQGHIADKGQI